MPRPPTNQKGSPPPSQIERRLRDFIFGAVSLFRRAPREGPDLPSATTDEADDIYGGRKPYDVRLATDPNVIVYRMSDAFSFGTAGAAIAVLDQIGDQHNAFVLDFTTVPFIDRTGAILVADVLQRAHRRGVAVFVSGAVAAIRQALVERGVVPPVAEYAPTIEDALPVARVRALTKVSR